MLLLMRHYFSQKKKKCANEPAPSKQTPSTSSCLHRMHSNTEPSRNQARLNNNVHFCWPAERHASLSTAISLPKVLLGLHASSNAERRPEKRRGLDVLACSFTWLLYFIEHSTYDTAGLCIGISSAKP